MGDPVVLPEIVLIPALYVAERRPCCWRPCWGSCFFSVLGADLKAGRRASGSVEPGLELGAD